MAKPLQSRTRAFTILAGALAGLLVLVAWFVLARDAVATEVEVTPAREAKYLSEMREHLGSIADQNKALLVAEGVRACEWLAQQPAGHDAMRDEDARAAFLAENPTDDTEIYFELLTNSWGHLCDEIYEDHIDDSPVPHD